MSANLDKLLLPVDDIRTSIEALLDGSFGSLTGDARVGISQIYSSSGGLYALIADIITSLGVENVCQRDSIHTRYIEYAVDIVNISDELLQGLDGPLTEEQYVAVDFINTAGQALQANADKIWLYSMLVHRQCRPELSLLWPDMLIPKNVFADYETDVECSVHIDADGPAIWADATLLKRSIHFVLDNAVRFTQSGFIQLAVRQMHYGIDIAVIDTGSGIAPDDLARVFEPFFQVDDHHEGIGLGLTLAKSLIELQNGSIRMDSTAGVGTTVVMSMPRAGHR